MRPSPTPSRNRRHRCLPALRVLLLGLATTTTPLSPAAAETLRFGGTGSAAAGMQLLGEAFGRSRPDVEFVLVGGLGSSGGITGVRADAINFAVTGRPLKDEEKDPGVVSFAYARTPFVFATHHGTADTRMTTAQVVSVYTGETAAWPDGTPLRLVLRPANESETATLRGISPQMQTAVDAALVRPG